MLRILSSKAQRHKAFWKPSKPYHVGIHWIAFTEYSQISNHVPGFHSSFRLFAKICIGKLATSSIRVKLDFSHPLEIFETNLKSITMFPLLLVIRVLDSRKLSEVFHAFIKENLLHKSWYTTYTYRETFVQWNTMENKKKTGPFKAINIQKASIRSVWIRFCSA